MRLTYVQERRLASFFLWFGLLDWWLVKVRGWERDSHAPGGELHYHKGTWLIYPKRDLLP